MMNLPPDVIELYPPDTLILADNVPPSCAIDSRGEVYYLHFAKERGTSDPAVMRVVRYPRGKREGVEVGLSLNPNASASFLEYNGTLYVAGHHNEYPGGKKKTHIVFVPVVGAVCPCQVF